jgi:hypothetical protein
MTESIQEQALPLLCNCHASSASHSRFKNLLAGWRRLPFGGGFGLPLRAYSADALLGERPRRELCGRAPATPIAMPGFTDLVTAVK